ncbi:MAG: DUF4291 domain-containing protein [Oscillospiraceae bacterium]|nr:DUF4291 domain-containing protein [Oscillospiraceae bacterium]
MTPQKQIRAVFDEKTIRVYQAFSPIIADEAVRNGTFGGHFSLNRMTWIKPSFLWMMYRCGWAKKEGQERVLAIDISRSGFDFAVKNAVASTHTASGLSEDVWKQRIARSDIRVQWDPEKDVFGNSLPYRSIQLGLRGQAVRDYVDEWIERITDITELVKELDQRKCEGEDISGLLPKEKVYLNMEV